MPQPPEQSSEGIFRGSFSHHHAMHQVHPGGFGQCQSLFGQFGQLLPSIIF